jgi:5'-phosphate synthase pdxT subunit
MGAPRIGVLALQGDVREHVTALTDSGASAFALRRLDDLATVDGVVIPGGESTTMSKLAILDGFMEPLRARRAEGLPMYGSCAGLIMLADTIEDARSDQESVGGIDMVVRRNAFGRQVDSFEADIDIPALGSEPFPAVFIRAPWVESVGPGVEVLARVGQSAGEGTIVAVRQEALLATAFHPEITGDLRVHQLFVEMVRKQS